MKEAARVVETETIEIQLRLSIEWVKGNPGCISPDSSLLTLTTTLPDTYNALLSGSQVIMPTMSR